MIVPLVMLAAVVGAQPPGGQAAEIELAAHVRAAPGQNLGCLREAVTGFLAGKQIAVDWSEANSTAQGAAARRRLSLEIDLSEPTRAALIFSEPGGAKQVREVVLDRGLDEVGCESLADVITSSVVALAATPPPRAAPAPVIAEAPRPDAALGGGRRVLALAYTVEPVASDVLQSGIEVAFGFRPTPARWREWLRLTYRLPVTIDADLASIRLQSLGLAWGGSVSSRGRHVWFEVASNIGLSVTFLDAQAWRAGDSVTTHGHLGADFASDLTVGLRLADQAAVYATLRLSLFAAEAVTVEVSGTQVFQSWVFFRPGLAFGVRWQ